jgi:hypothetical protein
MALGTLHLAAIPVLAGLAAGTGAAASYMIGSNPAAPAAKTETVAAPERPCTAQTWPYINQNCLGSAAEPKRKIRLVAAPSGVEPISYASNIEETTSPAVVPAEPSLVTGDTVLRQPQRIATTGIDAPVAQSAKPRVKRAQAPRNDRRFVAQSYQVPVEGQFRSADTRPVIVVRPASVEYIRCDDRRC